MPIDASIPLHGLLINRNDENLKQQRYQMGQAEIANKRRLADLLPKAAHGDQAAIDQLWAVDPNIAQHMDERQRQHAQAITQDLSAAVKWADTPEKWQYVQQHYGQMGVDLSPYGFQDRERGLVALNQISGYLKGDGQPTNLEREYQFLSSKDPKLADQFIRNRAEGSPLVANNGDGTFTIIPRGYASGGAPSGGTTVPQAAIDFLKANPHLKGEFDQKYGAGAADKILGGQTAPPSGGFP